MGEESQLVRRAIGVWGRCEMEWRGRTKGEEKIEGYAVKDAYDWLQMHTCSCSFKRT